VRILIVEAKCKWNFYPISPDTIPKHSMVPSHTCRLHWCTLEPWPMFAPNLNGPFHLWDWELKVSFKQAETWIHLNTAHSTHFHCLFDHLRWCIDFSLHNRDSSDISWMMQRQTVLSDNGFPKYTRAHVATFNTASWWFLMQCHLRGQRLHTFTRGLLPGLRFLWIPWIFSILCIVDGERPKYFAELHWEMGFLNCLAILSWNLVQNNFACSLFMHNHDTLTYYQYNLQLLPLSQIFGVCCSHQNQNLFIFTKCN